MMHEEPITHEEATARGYRQLTHEYAKGEYWMMAKVEKDFKGSGVDLIKVRHKIDPTLLSIYRA